MERKLFIQLSNITTPTISIAPNKYNLPFASMYHTDDSILQGALNAMSLWEGLGCTYPDGCGNRIAYTADVAVNIDAATIQNKTGFQTLINKGGSILNHSASANEEYTRLIQLQMIRAQYLEYLNYFVSGVVVPGADMGYGDAAITHQDLFVTSARGDVYDSMNSRMWYQEKPVENETGDPPYPVNRQFTDWDSDVVLEYLLGAFDSNITNNAEGRKFIPIGSHSPLTDSAHIARFTTFYQHIKDNYADLVLLCSFREWAEYILMRSVTVTEELNGSLLTVTIDDTDVPQIDQVSWFDNCFNLSGATIIGITSEGFDEVNFNASTGLINAHKRITDWSPAPIRVNLTYNIS